MMRRLFSVLFLAVFCMILPATLMAQRISLVTSVPRNTPLGNMLQRMAWEWRSPRQVQMHINFVHSEEELFQAFEGSDAILLDDPKEMKRLMPKITILNWPFLIRNAAELDLVLNSPMPELEQAINSNGLFALGWVNYGWSRLFSRYPVLIPPGLKPQRVGTGDAETELLLRAGYRAASVTLNNTLVSLASERIDAVCLWPRAAVDLRTFLFAKNMMSLPVAPSLGGIFIKQSAWSAIPDKYKPELIRITRRLRAELESAIPAYEARAIQSMANNGLVINQVSPLQEKLWYAEAERALHGLTETNFDQALYNRILTILKPYRE
jgi:TRAP-type C4-dicarboxylate transport system substrate-binding protein